MPWRAVLSAMAALMVGVGLARFAYAPLLPAVIAQGWFAPGAAGYLGAANLLGYLAGALAGRRVAAALGARRVLRGAMLAAAVSLAACSVPMPFAWFFGWRLLSGILGGMLMILGPSLALSHVPAARRGLAGGVIFTGVACGIAASGTLVPLLIRWGLTQAWLGLAAACLALTAAAWRGWPALLPPEPASPALAAPGKPAGRFAAVSVSYGLCAASMAPHMVFLVDYVARGLHWGMNAGSLTWVVFGIGALCGPIALGRLADRIGGEWAIRVVIAIAAVALLALLAPSPASLALSALFGGVVVTGITTVTLARVGARAGASTATRQRGWTQATVAWAVGQAAGTYGMAWLFGRTGGYSAMFAAALAALATAAVVEAVAALKRGAIASERVVSLQDAR